MNNPFWKVCGDNPETPAARAALDAYAAELAAHPDRQWAPDLWMSRSGNRFSADFVEGSFDTPLFPCRTVMRCPSGVSLGTVNHEQLYVGGGQCIRTHDFKNFATMAMKLTHLTRSRPLGAGKHFHLTHIQNVEPLQVLARARAALGRFCYSVFGTNCQNVTHWLLYGTKPARTEAGTTAATVLTIFLCTALAIIIVLIIAARARRHR